MGDVRRDDEAAAERQAHAPAVPRVQLAGARACVDPMSVDATGVEEAAQDETRLPSEEREIRGTPAELVVRQQHALVDIPVLGDAPDTARAAESVLRLELRLNRGELIERHLAAGALREEPIGQRERVRQRLIVAP